MDIQYLNRVFIQKPEPGTKLNKTQLATWI